MSHNNIGALLSQTGDFAAARGSFVQALEIQQRLADASPSSAELQREVAMSHNNIAAMLSRIGDLAGAFASCGKALAIQQRLAEANPSVTAFQLELARSHYNIGILRQQTSDPAGALAAHGQALVIRQKLADANLSVTEFQQDLANTDENIGNLLSATGDMPRAGEAHARALAIRQRLAEANPSVIDFRADVANSLTDLGWLLLKAGKPAKAIDYFSREEAIRQALARANPNVPSFRDSLANCETNSATVLLRLGKPAEARAHCEHAVVLREALVRAEANVPEYRKNLAESLLRFGQARQAAGDIAGASADWKRAVALLKSVSALDGEYVYYYAGCHALLSSIAGLTGTGVVVGERETHAERAMALLHQAAGMGYRNAGAYRTETALDPLRSREDFRLLMLDLAFPKDPLVRDPLMLTVSKAVRPAARAIASSVTRWAGDLTGDASRMLKAAGAINFALVRIDLATVRSMRRLGLLRWASGDAAGAISDTRRAAALFDKLRSRGGVSTSPCWWATERREQVERSKMQVRQGEPDHRLSLAYLSGSSNSLQSPFAHVNERRRGFVHGIDRR